MSHISNEGFPFNLLEADLDKWMQELEQIDLDLPIPDTSVNDLESAAVVLVEKEGQGMLDSSAMLPVYNIIKDKSNKNSSDEVDLSVPTAKATSSSSRNEHSNKSLANKINATTKKTRFIKQRSKLKNSKTRKITPKNLKKTKSNKVAQIYQSYMRKQLCINRGDANISGPGRKRKKVKPSSKDLLELIKKYLRDGLAVL